MGGLGPCVSIVGWVGLGEEKWTHVHLWGTGEGEGGGRIGLGLLQRGIGQKRG